MSAEECPIPECCQTLERYARPVPLSEELQHSLYEILHQRDPEAVSSYQKSPVPLPMIRWLLSRVGRLNNKILPGIGRTSLIPH